MKIWIGRRESDILTYPSDYFDGSITFYGSNKWPNISYCTTTRVMADYDLTFMNFLVQQLARFAPPRDLELYFYSNTLADKLASYDSTFKNCLKAHNKVSLTNWCNNKLYTRFWLSNSVKVPAYAVFSKPECTYNTLHSYFPGYESFVIQNAYSAGGTGTFKLTPKNEGEIRRNLSDTQPYLVSPYYTNTVSACCHTIISEPYSLIFPTGIQKIQSKMNNLSYIGTYYPKYLYKKNSEIEKFLQVIINRLLQVGYRGICGFDYLLGEDGPSLIEINPRFMGSSFIVNKALYDAGLPSLFTLNEMAFNNDIALSSFVQKTSTLYIPYECTSVNFNKHTHPSTVPQDAIMFYDGWNENVKTEDDAYMYRYISKRG